MKFELKCYSEEKHYIEYTDDNGEIFNNAEYFMFNVCTEEFENIMHAVGGFTANMTTRFIKEHNLNCTYIMLCCVPQKYNDFIFRFVYLDDKYNILTYMSDNNYYDYSYFKKKFESCICKKGFIYELEDFETLKELTQEFNYTPSIDFDFVVENRTVHYNDVLICSDFDIFNDKIKNNLEKLGAKYVEFQFDNSVFDFIGLTGKVYDSNGNVLKSFQVHSGILDKIEFLKMEQQKDSEYTENDIPTSDFEFTLSLSNARTLADKFSYRKV